MPEIVTLVDADGSPTGSAERSVVRRDNLRHAATAVLVRDPEGRIYVHRRSPTKDWAPGHHDAAAGGVLTAGEDPEESARRELEEELAVSGADLRPLGLNHYEDDTTRVVEHVYETTWDGPVVWADGEVVWGAWLTLDELAVRLADPGWSFVPDTRALLARLAADRVGDYARLSAR
ncbi:MAG: NUDIX domain-containing protein [Nocardioidaceae bacterium]|nr:NUDIX domain-containing protein [Nocardioidaceae bacterium]